MRTDISRQTDMTLSERAAWRAQRLIRRWSVLISLQVITVLWLGLGSDYARSWWNFVWSDLAIIIEGVTAIALVSLAQRDHNTLVAIERMEKRIETVVGHTDRLVTHLLEEKET